MSRSTPFAAALLAGVLAATAGLAAAFDVTNALDATHPSTSPEQPKPRAGGYTILSEGGEMIDARCDEGGYVFVAAHPDKPLRGGAPQSRDAAVRDACKSLDFTK